jgi:hypothetical protein
VIENVNSFIYAFSAPTLTDIPPSQPIAAATDPHSGSDAQYWHPPALKALVALLPQKEQESSLREDGHEHAVLVKLLDWDAKFHTTGSTSALDMFLSTCDASTCDASTCDTSSTSEEPLMWQECQYGTHPTM